MAALVEIVRSIWEFGECMYSFGKDVFFGQIVDEVDINITSVATKTFERKNTDLYLKTQTRENSVRRSASDDTYVARSKSLSSLPVRRACSDGEVQRIQKEMRRQALEDTANSIVSIPLRRITNGE